MTTSSSRALVGTFLAIVGILLVGAVSESQERPLTRSQEAAVVVKQGDSIEPGARRSNYPIEAWKLDNSGVVAGDLELEGASLSGADLGDVQWSVAGNQVSGVLVKSGKVVARFRGRVNHDGATGTYVVDGHRESRWKWRGPVANDLGTASEDASVDAARP